MKALGLKALNKIELNRIRNATIEVLENVGVWIGHEEAREILKNCGAIVEKDSEVVKIPGELLRKIFNLRSPVVRLYNRDGFPPLKVGKGNIYFGTQGFPINTLDWRTNEYRLATQRDLADIVRLADALENVDFIHPLCCPTDVAPDKADLYQWKISLMNTRKHIQSECYGKRSVCVAVSLAEKIAGGREELRKRPFISIGLTLKSPMALNFESIDVLIEGARTGIPLAVTSGAMCGANAPATLASTLVCANSEVLSAIAIAKLVNPAIPICYLNFCRIFDMKFGNISQGCPEFGLLRLGTAQLAKSYWIPSGGGGLVTDSQVPDEQAGYEKAMTGISAALGKTNWIWGMGLLGGCGIMSAEALAIDNEIVGYIRRFLRGISVEGDKIDMDLFRKVGVGPGSSFLAEEHTLRHFREEMWIPQLSDRNNLMKWREEGEMDIRGRARRSIERKLEKHVLPSIPNGFEEFAQKIIEG